MQCGESRGPEELDAGHVDHQTVELRGVLQGVVSELFCIGCVQLAVHCDDGQRRP